MKIPTRLPSLQNFLACILLLDTGAIALESPTREFSSVGPSNRHGLLLDGTEYWIRIPANWTGVLVNDLDAGVHLNYNTTRATIWTSFGHAYSGTSRRADRNFKFDPRAERDQQSQVIDIFRLEFGKPQYTIQFGCSGGGGVALGVAEAFPNHVDGAISANGGEGIVMSNQRLDLLFALKALLAPSGDLKVVGIGFEERTAAAQAWGSVLNAAMNTTTGRARILLAGALAQMPVWGGAFEPYLPEPNPDDKCASVMQAMLRSVVDGAVYAASVRYLYDNPAGVMSWNTGIDYANFFDDANEQQRRMVRQLYRTAGLDIAKDIENINAYPRLAPNDTAISYWKERALTRKPLVPVLQANTIGDSTRSAALMAAYAAGVERNGKAELYRQILVNAAGHCIWNAAEIGAAGETLLNRLRTGAWGNATDPSILNSVATKFDPNGANPARYTTADALPKKNNREYFALEGR